MKKQVEETRCTVSTHRYPHCLLKNMPTKQKKYVANQKLEHLGDISFLQLFGRIRVVFHEVLFVSSYSMVCLSVELFLFHETQLSYFF